MNNWFDTSTKASMTGGILTIILVNITSADMLKTAVLAAIGAVISFIVSQALKYMVRRWRR